MRSFGAFVSAGSFVNNVWDLGENRDFPSQDLIPRVLWTSVTAAISGGLLLRSGGAGSLFNPIRGARALMAAYEPIVEVDEKLTGNAVEIRTLNILGGGSRRVIFASPRAINNKDLINLHKEVVRDAALDEGFIANLGDKAVRRATARHATLFHDEGTRKPNQAPQPHPREDTSFSARLVTRSCPTCAATRD